MFKTEGRLLPDDREAIAEALQSEDVVFNMYDETGDSTVIEGFIGLPTTEKDYAVNKILKLMQVSGELREIKIYQSV